ncbi:MAG: hypothetical protein Q7T97_08270 [Burkholderiaceae bacterium]|nr:hypothetical protein [Burkholderiaceae bacterium]
MKCPICGHHLARLADPCLNCASVLSGRAGVYADAAAMPTSLTLPAEFRVADTFSAEAPPVRALAGAPPLRARPAKAHADPVIAGADPSERVSRTSGTATTAAHPAPTSGPPESGRTIAGSTIRTWAVAGVALALMVVYLGVQRPRNPVQIKPAIPATDAANVGRVVPAVAVSAVVPTTTVRRSIAPAPASARPGSTVAPARMKNTAPTSKPPEASLPAPLPSVAVVSAPSPPPSVTEPVLPVAPKRGVTDLRETCGRLGFVARALCVNERCAQAAYAGDAECVKLRKATEDAEQAVQRGG